MSTTALLERRGLVSLDGFPTFRKVQEGFQSIVDEFPVSRLWIDFHSDVDSSVIEGDWTVSPVYFGNFDGPEAVSGNPEHRKLRPFTDKLPTMFPRTTTLLQNIPEVNWAAFSRLPPATRLGAHTHEDQNSLTFHLGIVIPNDESCGLKVDDETHIWRAPGDYAIFDPRSEHSAWNDSDKDRVILHVDFVRPEGFGAT